MDAIDVLKKFIDLTEVNDKGVCICFTVNHYEDIGLLVKEESWLIKETIEKNKPDILRDKEISASYFKERNRVKNITGFLPSRYFYFPKLDWNIRRRYMDLLVKHLENERDNVLKLEL